MTLNLARVFSYCSGKQQDKKEITETSNLTSSLISQSVSPSVEASNLQNAQGSPTYFHPENETYPKTNLIIEKETPHGNDKNAVITFLVNKFVEKNLPQDNDSQGLNECFKDFLVKKLLETDGITPKKAEIFLNTITINIKELLKNTAFSELLILNFVRDGIWSWMTYAGTDWIKNEDSDLRSQTITQTIFSIIAMAVISVIYHSIKRQVDLKNNKPLETKILTLIKSSLLILGAGGLAIPTWNYMQSLGYNLGIELNMSIRDASYFSGTLTSLDGPILGFTAEAIKKVDNGVINSLKEFKQNPRGNILSFIAKLIIFGTLGGFGGAMWQIIYQGMKESVDENNNITVLSRMFTISLTLAFIVYICGLFFITGYEYGLNKFSLKTLINNMVDKTSIPITNDPKGNKEIDETTALIGNLV